MPYIEDTRRKEIDPLIEKLAANICMNKSHTAFAGELNYVVTRLLLKVLPEKRYWALALGVGTLICAVLEFYRRYISLYEDGALKKNGDIPEYQENL